MVVDAEPGRRELSEAILARLQFAVVPVESVDKAVSIAHALRPSVIVCRSEDLAGLRAQLHPDVPIVEGAPGVAIGDALVDVVRAALRVASVE